MTRLILTIDDPHWTPEVVTRQMDAWRQTRDELMAAKTARDWAGLELAEVQRANIAASMISSAMLSGSWCVEDDDDAEDMETD